MFQDARINSYCVGYACQAEGWKPQFKVCWCPSERYVEEIDGALSSNLTRCCPKTKLVVLNQAERKLSCAMSKEGEPEKHCLEGKS